MVGENMTLTKWDLYRNATIHLTVLGVVVGMIVTPFVAYAFSISGQTFWEAVGLSLAVAILSVIICMSFTTFIASVVPIKNLRLLKRQERYLAFNFNEEMQQYGIETIPAVTPKWFIVSEEAGIIVLRRDYVAQLEHIKFRQTSTGMIKGTMTIVTSDRKIVRLRHTKAVVLKFQQWLEHH